ncbi:CBS domain-containing protein [Streptomyces sp. NPDC056568]|uniref:CBS domain-containing protein n=1 Tax=Streptomyces sp. NPDC056568 TaxID=3345866 RepID=UPI00368200EE
MTPFQPQFRTARPHPAHGRAADPADAGEPQVWEDMTVEVALSVMAAAGTGRLVVADEDGLCTGLVHGVRLTAVRDGCGYTDRIRLRDVADLIGPPAPPAAAAA